MGEIKEVWGLQRVDERLLTGVWVLSPNRLDKDGFGKTQTCIDGATQT